MTRTLSASLAAASILGLAGVPVAGALMGGSPAGAANASVEAQVFALVNADRTTRGLPALAVDPTLVGIARAWSDHLLATASLAHNVNLGRAISPPATAWGENVGMGGTAAGINAAWLSSPTHYANLVGNYNFVGVGVSTRIDGTQFITVDYELIPMPAPSSAPVSGPRVAIASAPAPAPAPVDPSTACRGSNPPANPNPAAASGYSVMGPDGGIFTIGAAPYLGSLPGSHIGADAVGLALTPDQRGYWELGRDGGVFGFGTARYHGSVPGLGLPMDAARIAPTPSGNGYWVLGRDGGVANFGDAPFLGSLPGLHVAATAVGLAPTPSGRGYWILAADGGVFGFGDAAFHGSPAGLHVAEPAVAIAATPSGQGYWVLGERGGVYSFGDAVYHGSLPGTGCTTAGGVALTPTSTGQGYEILATTGQVFGFGDAPHFPQAAGGELRGMALTH